MLRRLATDSLSTNGHLNPIQGCKGSAGPTPDETRRCALREHCQRAAPLNSSPTTGGPVAENASDERKAALTTHRLEALADGIFAIAMTLLVLNLNVPELGAAAADARLSRDLLAMWPHFSTYALSFFLLAVFWHIHHRQFHLIKQVNEPLLWLNVAALMLVALIPFSTSLQSEYGNLRTGAIFFEANMLAAGLAFAAQFRYASRNHRLVDPKLDPQVIAGALRRGLVLPVVSAVAMGISLVSPANSGLVYLAIPFILRSGPMRRT